MAKETKKKKKKEKVVSYIGTGRRKDSVARIRLVPGTGKVSINGKELEAFFNSNRFLIKMATSPLSYTENEQKYDTVVTVSGGGAAGQAGAIRHGIARDLENADESLRDSLKKAGFLTRDSRMKERRKYGLKKARKAPQFSKR
ncbi:MAG: 30S ribosomal protein S9 [Actinobacteria bacterium]|nr:MAG: 30S ribosomal protein S9 [Actinomycetota bacterium]